MKFGYARVSTSEQKLDLQIDALKKAGCEKIFEDHVSGGSRKREGLDQLWGELSEGDELIVWKLDRLGRSLSHLIKLIDDLDSKGVRFRSISDSIDTSTPMGKFFFHISVRCLKWSVRLLGRGQRRASMPQRQEGAQGGDLA